MCRYPPEKNQFHLLNWSCYLFKHKWLRKKKERNRQGERDCMPRFVKYVLYKKSVLFKKFLKSRQKCFIWKMIIEDLQAELSALVTCLDSQSARKDPFLTMENMRCRVKLSFTFNYMGLFSLFYLDKRAFRSQKLRLPSTSPSTRVSPFQAMQAMLPMLPCNKGSAKVYLELQDAYPKILLGKLNKTHERC